MAARDAAAGGPGVTPLLCEYAPHQPLESLVLPPTPSPGAPSLTPHLPPPPTRSDVHPGALAQLICAGQSQPDILSDSSARANPRGIY